MFRKHFIIYLFLILIINVAEINSVWAGSTPNLTASYVKFSGTEGGQSLLAFPAVGTQIYASAEVTNHDENPQSAVLWVGVYKDEVLLDIEYKRMVIPAGEADTFVVPVTIPEGSIRENTEIIAYIWDSFAGGNAITASANFLRDRGELSCIKMDGKIIDGFSNSKYDYKFTLPNGVLSAAITARAKDNATKIEIQDYTIPGIVYINVTQSNGIVNCYSVELKITGKITSLTKNQASPKTASLNWGDKLVPVTSYAYTDRSSGSSGMYLIYASEDLVGETMIRMPINDVRCTGGTQTDTDMIAFMNGNNTYYTFKADTKGTIYCLANYSITNYPNNGWVTLNSGTSFFPVEYNGTTYTAYNRCLDENGVDKPAVQNLPYSYNPENITSISRHQGGAPSIYKYAYAKSFQAGEDVSVPTLNIASTGSVDGAVWFIKWGEQLFDIDMLFSLSYEDKNVDISDIIIYMEHKVLS